MAGPTQIPAGSPLAAKLYSVALFAEAQRKHSFKNAHTGAAPKQTAAEKLLRAPSQTPPDFPIVVVRDLSKGMADQVSIDLVNVTNVRPTMSDKKLAGRMGGLSFSSMDLRIDQCRFGVDSGGRMSQHRTVHQLRALAKANLVGLNVRFEDQITQTHLAGARGFQNTNDWVVPLASDSEFTEIVVNTVMPPSFSRRIIAGGGDSIDDIGTSDFLLLPDIDRIRVIIDQMAFPLQPIKLPSDPAADDEPLYVLHITPLQAHHLRTATGDVSWRTFLQAAHNRGTMTKHPLFTGALGMWSGILIKKMGRSIRFETDDICDEENSAGTVVNTAAVQPTDRAILLGAQAAAWAYGKHGTSKTHYMWNEEMTDHKNVREISTSAIAGCSKIRFTNSEGTLVDHGAMVLDAYAPTVA
jgi:N4-gp56 family major capsid protein